MLRNFQAWESLKKALKSRSIRIEEPLEELRMVTRREPRTRAHSALGEGGADRQSVLYYLLYSLDEDFRELFKVKVDFDDSFRRTPETELLYARFVGGACRDSGLRHFGADAVAKLVEHGSRARRPPGAAQLAPRCRFSISSATPRSTRKRGHACVTAQDVEPRDRAESLSIEPDRGATRPHDRRGHVADHDRGRGDGAGQRDLGLVHRRSHLRPSVADHRAHVLGRARGRGHRARGEARGAHSLQGRA